MKLIDYSEYRFFKSVIEKSILSCGNSNINVSEHFEQMHDMIEVGKGAKRKIANYHLSRYACYLIIQNADPSKELVALGQTYFAVQTRKQELQEEFEKMTENEKRLQLRNEMKKHNIHLADAAKNAGVIEPIDYAIFQNHGYKGLYGGFSASEIKQRKKLKKSQDILDHMGSEELAANLFRETKQRLNLEEKTFRAKKVQIKPILK
jgi:DNA-damage-inducible protein D